MSVDAEVEDVGDLEIGSVIENQISANYYVDEIRRWRREHGFHFRRARVHVSPGLNRHESVHDQPALQSWRKVVAPRKTRRQVTVVVVIPAAEIAIVVGVTKMIMVAPVIVVTVGVAVSMVVAVVLVPAVVVAVVLAVSVIMILRRQGRRERKRYDRARSRSNPEV